MADAAGWTLGDAATWLDPPISAEVLGLLVKAAVIASGRPSPVGTRKPPRGSAGGRPAAVYEIRDLMELHAAFVPWLLGPGRLSLTVGCCPGSFWCVCCQGR